MQVANDGQSRWARWGSKCGAGIGEWAYAEGLDNEKHSAKEQQ